MDVFLRFEDGTELKLNDTTAGYVPRKGDILERESTRGAATVRYEVVEVVSYVDFRSILRKIEIVLRQVSGR